MEMKNVFKYKGFTGSYSYDESENVYFGKIEGINDLITFEGQDIEELREGFQFMVEEHLSDSFNEKE